MRRVVWLTSFLLLVAVAALVWVQVDRPPAVEASALPPTIGRNVPLRFTVHSPGPGLERVWVVAQGGQNSWQVYEQRFERQTWRGSGVERFDLEVAPDWPGMGIPEGPLVLQIWAATYGWHLRGHDRAPLWQHTVELDLTPPRVEVLTTQHNVRLGGVELAIWRQSPDAVRFGVEVERYFFPGYLGYFSDPQLALALFAVPQDLDPSVQARVIAEDRAGNRTVVQLPVRVLPRRFAERTLLVDDEFLVRKVPEIEAANQLPATGSLIDRYLRINRELRHQNEATLRELTRTSDPSPKWLTAFHRQSNAAPLSSFADRRTYVYRGQEIDRQVHLGFDLASIKASPVEAAQEGRVVFAGNLGIYGNTVILDHGMGLFTLYGHLRSIDVPVGATVKRGQTLGLTGETGLAAGDHLHFSVMLHGVHVDPVEWWDEGWIRKHLIAKLSPHRPMAAAPKDDREQ